MKPLHNYSNTRDRIKLATGPPEGGRDRRGGGRVNSGRRRDGGQ